MDTNQRQKIERNYIQRKLDASYQTLVEIMDLIDHFSEEGGARLQEFVHMRKRSKEEINHLSNYMFDARTKMEKEYDRALRHSEGYNEKYPNNIGNYFGDISNVLSKLRSHMSALKTLLRRGCTTSHVSSCYYMRPETSPKPLIQSSVMGRAPYCNPIFPMEEEVKEVQYLFEQVKAFYAAEKKCMDLCVGILNNEKKNSRDSDYCFLLLNNERQKAWQKMEDEICLISEDVINTIKETNPAYKDRCNYASEREFAPFGFHRYNESILNHLHLLDYYISRLKKDYTPLELSLWGNQYDVIDNVRKVVADFDNLLPEHFSTKDMGRYLYYFCNWALPSNMKKVHKYFVETYKGKYKTVNYGAVMHHKETFNSDHVEHRVFISNIANLISLNGKKDWKKEFENRLASL